MDEHTLNDLLECSVCLDRLDTTSKVLPCQHTFCRKCLEVIIFSHSELRCPECRILVDTKIGDLPPNVLLMRILEGMKNFETHANHKQQTVFNSAASENLSMNSANNRKDLQSISDNQTFASPEATTNNSLSINAGENVAATLASTVATSREPHSRRTTQNNQENSPKLEQQQQQQQIAKRIEQSNIIRPTNLLRQPLQNNKQLPQNIASLSTPHAKALYDFESKESGDLSFKKGDMIALLRRIDVNWFVGECNGCEGVFPVNYVQVLVALPQPQCKALYDFKMGPNEEEGCLTFKKGAIIIVLRRVDQNWAEGRIGDTIGIFPIQFVEMNSLAKYVIDASSKYGRRIVPATPNGQNNKHNGFSSDTSSTTMTTTSPNSSATSNTSSNSSTAPNSPLTHNQPTAHNASHTSAANDNRFSLNATVAANANSISSNGMSKNRHSKDIVVQSNAKIKPNAQKHLSSSSSSSSSKSATQNDSTHNNHRATKSSSSKSNSSNGTSHHRVRQSSPSASSVPSNAFVALYPYKSQKSDELELKKGSIYYVKERCQDGWFRGTNRAQKSGVFPGNYVAPLRNDGSGSGHPANIGAVSNNQKRLHGNNSTTNQTNVAPKLPPRSSTGSVWSKPIGQHVEALFGRSQSSLIKRITNIKRSKSPVANQSISSYSMDNPVFEDNTIGCVESVNSMSTATNTKRSTIHLSHPVHVRSGSCPSQLLQSLPIEININSASNTNGGYITKADMFGSQRVKGHRERPTLQALRQNMEAANGRSKNGESSSSYHRKSQSLDAATIAEQIANCSTVDANAQSKRKSYTHNEKFKCIVSYPPNSEFELELMVGDIVFVHKKRDNGWYKGYHARTGKIGLFPSSFVEPDI